MEEFKDYGDYKVGNQGTIIGKYGKILKPNILIDNYCQIKIYSNNISKTILVHRLVAELWILNPNNKPQIDHINRIRTDNRVENLRWVTQMENMTNVGLSKKNISGIQGLSFNIITKYWYVKKKIYGIQYSKYFKLREEAEAYLKSLPITNEVALCGEAS